MNAPTTDAAKIPQTLARLAKPIDSVKPYEGNAREHDLGAIGVSLDTNGQFRPIVVNKRADVATSNTILAGNGTWLAAKQLGWDKLAMTFVDVDDATARRIVLADNRHNDLASYDDSALLDLLKGVVEDGGTDALLGTGFDGDDMDDLVAKIGDGENGNGTEPGLGAVEYRIIVTCNGEQHQAELLQRFEDEGLTVQALAQ